MNDFLIVFTALISLSLFTASRSNIVLIFADDHGWNVFSSLLPWIIPGFTLRPTIQTVNARG